MRKKSLFSVCLAVLALIAGCSGLEKAPPQKVYYTLSGSDDGRAGNPLGTDLNKQGEPVLVKELLISPTFDSHAFVYRTGENEYQTDFYTEFVSYPARLVTDRITENLFASPWFCEPRTDKKQDIQYRLSGKILNLYADLRPDFHPGAVLEIRLFLEKKQDRAFSAFFSRTYRSNILMDTFSPEETAQGWGRGLTSIIDQFLADFQSIP